MEAIASQAVRQAQALPEKVEAALLNGDVSGLDAAQRMLLYGHMCRSVGLNPWTKPFALMKGQGGVLWYYASKNCTDQLRQVHQITLKVIRKEIVEGCYVVTAKAFAPDLREDEDIGVVHIDGLKGEPLANAMMKAHTKAKRRVTLSICGLSMLDESELEGVPSVVAVPPDAPSPGVQQAMDRFHARAAEVTAEAVLPYPAVYDTMTTKQLRQAIKGQFDRLADAYDLPDLLREVFGIATVDDYAKLPADALKRGLAILEPMRLPEPPSDPRAQNTPETHEDAPGSTIGSEDVTYYSEEDERARDEQPDAAVGGSEGVIVAPDLELLGGFLTFASHDVLKGWCALHGHPEVWEEVYHGHALTRLQGEQVINQVQVRLAQDR